MTDHLLSPILLNLLPTFSRLNCLKITSLFRDWNTLDSSLASAFLHLMHLPTINHIDLSFIQNFPLPSLTLSVNLHRLDIVTCSSSRRLEPFEEDDSPELVVDMLPKIREFHTLGSSLLTTTLLHAKRQDGRPAFNFLDLRRLEISFIWLEDEQNVRYLLQNAKLLETLHLLVDLDRSLIIGLLSLSARTLKVLDLTVSLYHSSVGGLCEELEAMAGHNMLEAFSFEVHVEYLGNDTEEAIGSTIQKMEKVLVKKPGWSVLRQVSFKVTCSRVSWSDKAKLSEALQSLPDKYLSHLSKIDSIAFNYSAHVTCY